MVRPSVVVTETSAASLVCLSAEADDCGWMPEDSRELDIGLRRRHAGDGRAVEQAPRLDRSCCCGRGGGPEAAVEPWHFGRGTPEATAAERSRDAGRRAPGAVVVAGRTCAGAPAVVVVAGVACNGASAAAFFRACHP